MTHIFELKSREEHWLLFKYLKLIAIFVAVYASSYAFILYTSTGRRRKSDLHSAISENIDLYLDITLYISLAAVMLYVIHKVRFHEIEKFEFNDSVGKLRVSYRNFFTHYRFTRLYFYSDLRYRNKTARGLLSGEYDHIEIFSKEKKIAVIGSAAVDWHKLPNTTLRLKEKLWTIQEGISGDGAIFSAHLPKYTIEGSNGAV